MVGNGVQVVEEAAEGVGRGAEDAEDVAQVGAGMGVSVDEGEAEAEGDTKAQRGTWTDHIRTALFTAHSSASHVA
jgi:hypothetical protein